MARMMQIDDYIKELQETREKFGNTCVYIRDVSWGAVALNRQAEDERLLTQLAVDDGQAVANNVREAIKSARHWMLESEETPRPEIKREVVITYLNMIERSLETPIATKA